MAVGRGRKLAAACGVFVATLCATYATIHGTSSIRQLASSVARYVTGSEPRLQTDAGISNADSRDLISPRPGLRRPRVDRPGKTRIADETFVIGVTVADHHRAYSCVSMSNPLAHVINDLIRGVPVTVTYCDRTLTARVLTANDCNEPLNVNFHGIIGDQMKIEIDGRVVDQTARDLPLADIEFTQTTWGQWKESHPTSDVYSLVYPFSDNRVRIAGIRHPEVESAAATRLLDKTPVIGVMVESRTRAYVVPAMRLPSTHVINDLLGTEAVTVAYCDVSDCARVLTEKKRGSALDLAVAGYIGGQLAIEIDGRTFGLDEDDLPLPDLEFSRTTWGEWKTHHPETDVYVGNYSESLDSMLGD